ncbi:cholesterol transporter ABCA5 [Microcaecilia unicolor]|uniref:ATP-binding cassette sub-family A member 5 n=1 Tax=Microcaecilia unicolor TaxID=1415580 RepID=A0A6P7YH58_9AMPH|nr:ATP-binding cassette sub-family A member 5 [Microcaecilia unicolor]
MAAVSVKGVGVWRQTKALLYKNYLVKRRTTKNSLQEILFPVILLSLLILISLMSPSKQYKLVPNTSLGTLDNFTDSQFTIGYTPVTNATRRIMHIVSSHCFAKELSLEEYADEEELNDASTSSPKEWVGLVFKDTMSYKLRFFPVSVPDSTVYIRSSAGCSPAQCIGVKYLHSAFTALQACIDSALIQLKTGHIVWEKLKSTEACTMEKPASIEIDTYSRAISLFYLTMMFLPFGYYLSIHIVEEKKKKLKEYLIIMGLHNTAYWLSWVLLYAGFILIMSLLMTITVTTISPFSKSNIFLIFFLFFSYGISSMFFALMLTPVFKNSAYVGTVEILATIVFGGAGLLIVLVEDFPKAFVWLLSPICHCTFLVGIAQVMHLEDFESGALFSNLKDGPYPLIITYIFLVVDTAIYLLLAVYLDQILPGEYGLRRTLFFFLKPSYWSKRRKYYSELDETTVSRSLGVGEMVESISSEFRGKEAIRINSVQKSFRKKHEQVEAVRGLSFEIYEGQITALLGHSGTGKTTLLNILCGLCPPSDGFATVYGYRVTEIDEMLELRKMIGVCPQSDVHFEHLTVEENLSVFAAVKGVELSEVQRVLQDLDMQAIKDNQARALSGGQRRKLTLGIAIIGNPKVLLLDEPTAGMDPCARHGVWNLLKLRKADGVIVFSTHFMEEADILADRKVVISQGTVKCIGSSLFLKIKWGVGYCLSIHIDKSCSRETVTSVIIRHIPGADLLHEHEQQLVYTLPLKDTAKFSGLFSDLDSHLDLGVITYGVSMTTLEDAFLKLEAEAEIGQADYSALAQQRVEERSINSLDEIEQSLLVFPELRSSAAGSAALWKRQFCAVARFHALNVKRESKSMRTVLFLLLIFLAFQIFLFVAHRYLFQSSVAPVKLSPDLYFLKPGQRSRPLHTSLLLQNNAGSGVDDIISSLTNQKVQVELINGSDYLSVSPHNAALKMLHSEKSYTFAAIFNTTMVHALPVLVNIISNLLLQNLNVTESIEIWSSPFFKENDDFKIFMYLKAVLLGILISVVPYFAMENTDNRKMKIYCQLMMSGLYRSAYWTGQAAVDIAFGFVIVTLMLASLFMFHYGIHYHTETLLALIFCLIGYVPAVVLFTYVASFTYKKVKNTQDFWSFIFSLMSMVTVTAIVIAFFTGKDLITTSLHYLFSIFVPIYPFVGCLVYFIKMSWRGTQSPVYYNPWDKLLVSVLLPYLHCAVFLYLLRYLEAKNGGKSLRRDPFFSVCSKEPKHLKFSEVASDEDEDVQAERTRVGELLASKDSEETPSILVSSLHKEYPEKRNFLLGRKIKKLATKNISLCVGKGEILGLLGPNGAGKSTLINILAGDTEPSAGQVYMDDNLLEGRKEINSVSFVGYCPQINPLWPEITLEEHLEIYGAIKGMNPTEIKEVIKRISSAFALKDELKKPAKKLSAGMKRKLCFALSFLGNPEIMLLDEPSTGMDPRAKQQMWKAMRAAFRSGERAAILSTHYIEEVDALCDRVAILVSGQLRCIGTVQHLKSKFGSGYYLEVKVADMTETQKELLHKEILQIFPNASRQGSFSALLSYKIPKENVPSLSQCFLRLEEAKCAFNIEEYSFSQSTLEQVFIELTKEQQEEDEDNFGTMNSRLFWEKEQEDRVVF